MRKRRVGIIVFGMAMSLWSAVLPVQAANYAVTKGDDTRDGVCDADCSLREAIIAANANAGADTLTLPAGTYTLSIPSTNEDASADGDLDITDDLTITGAGSSVTIVDGNGGVTGDRVFDIDPTFPGNGPSVSFSNLTIRGGSAPLNGGGVNVRNTGQLTLTNVLVTGNGAGDTGGGIHAEDSSTVTIANSTVKENMSSNQGGGIGNWDDAVMTITDSTISGNTAEGGDGGGLINENQAQLTVINSTLSGNESTTDRGGGILANNTGVLTLTNSTISGNRAAKEGGGFFLANTPTVILTHVTITNNTADSDGNGDGNGGGIRNENTASVNLTNTILAGNTDGSPGAEAPDCSGPVVSSGHTLLGVNTGCTFTSATGDQLGTGGSPIDPMLGPLQDNGGPTLTHALLPGSSAIDAADDPACPATDQRGMIRPQDGDNDSAAVCDIGAYEAFFGAPNIVVTDSVPPANDLLVSFADLAAGLASEEAVTINNSGDADLVVGTIGLTNPLQPPFSLVSDACSGQTLAPAASCGLSVEFSPTAEGTFNDSFDVPSNDPNKNSVTVNVTGTGLPASAGNSPPSEPALIAPEDGATGVSVPVTFRWTAASDPDGDPVAYELSVCDDPGFPAGCAPIPVASAKTEGILTAMAYKLGILFFGMILAGVILDRRWLPGLIGLILTGMLLVSCGHSGGGGGAPSGEISHTVPGLLPGTTYYWKVAADDGAGGQVETVSRSFTTK